MRSWGSNIGPTTQNPPLVRSWISNVGPTTELQNFSVGPMLVQCQHANNDVLPTTLTIAQRWPNDWLLSRKPHTKLDAVDLNKRPIFTSAKHEWIKLLKNPISPIPIHIFIVSALCEPKPVEDGRHPQKNSKRSPPGGIHVTYRTKLNLFFIFMMAQELQA